AGRGGHRPRARRAVRGLYLLRPGPGHARAGHAGDPAADPMGTARRPVAPVPGLLDRRPRQDGLQAPLPSAGSLRWPRLAADAGPARRGATACGRNRPLSGAWGRAQGPGPAGGRFLLTSAIKLIAFKRQLESEAMKERQLGSVSGLSVLAIAVLLAVCAVWLFVSGVQDLNRGNDSGGWLMGAGLLVGCVVMALLAGLYTIQPNQAAVLSLFGKYVGTVKEAGLRWNNPFYSK